MSWVFSEHQKLIGVGINGSNWDMQLVRAAARLAERSGHKIELVHVLEPWVVKYANPVFPFDLNLQPNANATQQVDDDRRAALEAHLNSLGAELGERLEGTQIIEGDVSDTLLAYARPERIALLVMGGVNHYPKGLPKTFSHTLNIMAHSEVPVLIIPHDSARVFEGDTWQLLVADDLTEQSLPALEAAYSLGLSAGPIRLDHVHVNSLAADRTESELLEIYFAAAGESKKVVDTEAFITSAQKKLVDTMKERATRAGIEACCSQEIIEYQAKLLGGEVVESVKNEANSLDADLVLFGRHKPLHHRWLPFGRVNYQAMVTLGRPALVAP